MEYNNRASKMNTDPGVAQLVARMVWDHDAGGSNPSTRTQREAPRQGCFSFGPSGGIRM